MDKKKIMKIIVIIGIIIIPIMYSFFYLKAFWDPYGNLEGVPVAIVNLDEGENADNLGKDLVKTLQDKNIMQFDVLGEEEANTSLVNQEYYAVITIPKDFTKTLNNAENKDRQVATITYSPNQKNNYLASQIISKVMTSVESELRGQVNEKVVNALSDKLNEVPEQLEKINDGATELKDGTNTLSEGLNTLKNGTQELATNYVKFDDGINSAYKGSKELNTGINTLSSGINQVYAGVQTITSKTKDLSKLTDSVNTLAAGTNSLNTGVLAYVGGVKELSTNVEKLLSSIVAYGEANPSALADANFKQIYGAAKAIKDSGKINELVASGQKLSGSTNTINQGMQTFKDGTGSLTELVAGINQLENSMGQLKSGADKLKIGSTTLNKGLQELDTNSDKIKSGITELNNGSGVALEGSKTLLSGVDTFKTEIQNGLTDTKEQLTNLNGLGEYAKAPVAIEENDYGKIDSYGVGFAPYFMSLSLWVGSLVMFITLYYDPDNRFKRLGKNAENKVLRAILFAGIAASQAVVLGFLLKLGLGFSVTNIWLYYGTCILISLVFFSIIQCLIVNFGDVGKFLSILFLVLQLAASGGTFPIETVPVGFQKIFPFMPLTYSIRLIKESIVSIDAGFISKNILVLLGIFAFFFICTIIGDIVRTKKKKKEEIIVRKEYKEVASANK